MRPGVFVNVDAGVEWRELSGFRRFLVWLVARRLARAAANEADQADVLGIPRRRPEISGRATDLLDDWGGRR
jgi:hypothetical protein